MKKKFFSVGIDMQIVSSGDNDEFGITKIFSDDAANPKFYKFQSGDKRKFNRHYGSCPKNGDDTHSVITTEWNKIGDEFIFVNQEVTGYFYLPKIDSDEGKDKCYKYERGGMGSALAIKLRGGKHEKGDDSAKCYIFDFQYEGKHEKEKNFQKEYPHGAYYKMNVVPTFDLKNNLKKWVGYKAVTMNQGDTVRCIALIDYGSENRSIDEGPDPNLQIWKVYYDVTDDGKLDEKYDITKEENYKGEVKKPWKSHFGDRRTQYRMDRIVKPEARFLSARRVAVTTGSIDDILNPYLP